MAKCRTGKRRQPRCRECGLALAQVSPRSVITITPDSKVAQGKPVRLLLGQYCSSDCALEAYTRGIPQHH